MEWSANDKGIECILTWDLVILKRESQIGFYTDVMPTIDLVQATIFLTTFGDVRVTEMFAISVMETIHYRQMFIYGWIL
jgi:hypothetical protein